MIMRQVKLRREPPVSLLDEHDIILGLFMQPQPEFHPCVPGKSPSIPCHDVQSILLAHRGRSGIVNNAPGSRRTRGGRIETCHVSEALSTIRLPFTGGTLTFRPARSVRCSPEVSFGSAAVSSMSWHLVGSTSLRRGAGALGLSNSTCQNKEKQEFRGDWTTVMSTSGFWPIDGRGKVHFQCSY